MSTEITVLPINGQEAGNDKASNTKESSIPITSDTKESSIPTTTSIPITSNSQASSIPITSVSMLKDGIKVTWLGCYLAASFLTIASFVFLNTTQSFLLLDHLHLPPTALASAQGNLSAVDEGVAVVMGVVWGVVSDRVGRKPVFVSGFLLMGVALMLYPFSVTVYAGIRSVLLFRIIFALGGAAAADMLTAVLSDYSRDGHRSRLAGLMGFSTGLGACFGALVLARMAAAQGRVDGAFWGTAGLMAGGALMIGVGMRFPSVVGAESKCWWKRILFGFQLIRRNPSLLVAYYGGFVARGNSVVLPVFLGARMVELGVRERRVTAGLVGVCQVAALLGAPLMGWLGDMRRGAGSAKGVDRKDAVSKGGVDTHQPQAQTTADHAAHQTHPQSQCATDHAAHQTQAHQTQTPNTLTLSNPQIRLLLACALVSACAYSSMPFLNNPSSPLLYLSVVAQGLAQIGTIITSMSLVAAESPAEGRGAVAGVYSLWGAVGIVVVGKGGAWMAFKGTGPFWLMAAINAGLVVLIVGSVRVCVRSRR